MRLKFLFVSIFVMIMLCGCDHSDSEEKYQSPGKVAQLQSEAIIEHVVNKDVEALKEMFCKHVKNTHDLDAEIETFLNSIEGEIVSYDEPRGSRGGGTMTEEDGVVEQLLYGRIDNIKTDTGKLYRIGFDSYQVCKKNPDYVGVTNIAIVNKDDLVEDYGYPDETIVKIGGLPVH